MGKMDEKCLSDREVKHKYNSIRTLKFPSIRRGKVLNLVKLETHPFRLCLEPGIC